jgi:hypothetical protein
VNSQELVSWELVRNPYNRGYMFIAVRTQDKKHRLSTWIVSGNYRYGKVLEALRTFYGEKETRS